PGPREERCEVVRDARRERPARLLPELLLLPRRWARRRRHVRQRAQPRAGELSGRRGAADVPGVVLLLAHLQGRAGNAGQTGARLFRDGGVGPVAVERRDLGRHPVSLFGHGISPARPRGARRRMKNRLLSLVVSLWAGAVFAAAPDLGTPEQREAGK